MLKYIPGPFKVERHVRPAKKRIVYCYSPFAGLPGFRSLIGRLNWAFAGAPHSPAWAALCVAPPNQQLQRRTQPNACVNQLGDRHE
jgi:hypothetical protein